MKEGEREKGEVENEGWMEGRKEERITGRKGSLKDLNVLNEFYLRTFPKGKCSVGGF